MQRIAVIGGGAAGAAVAGEFLRRGSSDKIALTWFAGRTPAPGRGIAYSTPCRNHLLNVRAANMGLFSDDVSAFARFAQDHDATRKPGDFLPRSLYGDYVQATLAQLSIVHAVGCSVDLRANEAVSLQPCESGYLVKLDDRSELHADGIVLALGAPPQLPLPYVEGSSIASGRYLLDPWSIPQMPLDPQRVIVIGAGLTATDVILSAAARWPLAAIVSISRHGRLPGRQSLQPREPFAHQADLIETMRSRPHLGHWLRSIREAVHDAADWRTIIDGLRSSTIELWQSLDVEQRARFLRHARWAWELARHRMAPAAAEEIEMLRDAGRLDVQAGRIRRVAGAAPVAVTFRRRRDGTVETLGADLVVQTTGFQLLTDATPHRLLRQMLKTGLARIDELGLGLDADANGRLIRADGNPAGSIRALGALMRGTLWECSSLPEIRAAATRIVRELPRELRRGGNAAQETHEMRRVAGVYEGCS